MSTKQKTDVPVSATTGLPELPDNQFWRVEHPITHYGSTILYGNSYPELTVEKDKLIVRLMERTEEDQTKQVTKRRWWGGKRVTICSEPTTYDKMLAQQTCLGTAPIAVLNAANRIVKRQAKLAQAHALVGDYPPKKLELT